MARSCECFFEFRIDPETGGGVGKLAEEGSRELEAGQ